MKQAPWTHGALRVEGAYLYNGQTPFFWLGDTAWLMFHRLTREQIETYLRNRADKGYTVIQAVAVMRMPARNAYGQSPFVDDDFSAPAQDGYWDLIDAAFDIARQVGLYIGLLPVWGSLVGRGAVRPEQAEGYARFLAQRYGRRENLIWINGGDTRGNENREFWCTMGRTLKALNPDRLVTFHPFGRTLSADYFPTEDWCDFHMFQSGHRRYDQVVLNAWDDQNRQKETFYWYGEDNWRYVQRAFDRPAQYVKPVLDAEPSYEALPQGLHDKTQPRWTAADVRRYAYWSVLAGACGFTYGHCDLMRMALEGEAQDAKYGQGYIWRDALMHVGSDSVCHLKRLLTALPYTTGKAAQQWIDEPEGERYERVSCFKGDGFLLLYTFTGRTLRVKAHALDGDTLYCWWFNPETGVLNYAGRFDAAAALAINPPRGQFPNRDWALFVRNTAQCPL